MCDQHRFFFEFDKAFTRQLIEKFEASPAHPLTEDVAPPEKGVYALYRKRRLVYAGKALDTTLKRRLAEHARKISGRRNIDPAEMTYRFLIIESDWFVRGRRARAADEEGAAYLPASRLYQCFSWNWAGSVPDRKTKSRDTGLV